MPGPDAVAVLLPAVGVAFAVLYVGYVAYEARVAREARARAPPPGPDPVLELARTNDATILALAEGRATLERARKAIERGVKG